MRNLFIVVLLLVAVAAGAQTEPDIIGDETMISGIDRVFIVGTYVGRPSSETGPAIFMVYRHTRDGGTYYLCIAYGKRAAMTWPTSCIPALPKWRRLTVVIG